MHYSIAMVVAILGMSACQRAASVEEQKQWQQPRAEFASPATRDEEDQAIKPVNQTASPARKGGCEKIIWQYRNKANLTGGPMSLVRVPVCIRPKP